MGERVNASFVKAARLRLEAMQAQLMAASTYCSTAENAIGMGRVENGRTAIAKARHTAETVRVHILEPNHVAADFVAEIRQRLTELDRRISTIEARL